MWKGGSYIALVCRWYDLSIKKNPRLYQKTVCTNSKFSNVTGYKDNTKIYSISIHYQQAVEKNQESKSIYNIDKNISLEINLTNEVKHLCSNSYKTLIK
jgi:hypothetical protein